ncbi:MULTISPECIES: hypothetical protein [unclassified Ensifer]|uniref:hypothetical protein n=1 Tax=unclassified Ensifer TaxID=2633371 RepID=UPI000A7FCB2D|nr:MULTISPECIES: hypothetical protein [unclassified Ensifer]
MVNQHRPPMQHHDGATHNYIMFTVNMVLSLIVMYFVMFSMIDGWADFRNNLNTAYMALTMVAPMGIIMLATMGGMYGRTGLNVALYIGLAVLFVAALAGTRKQSEQRVRLNSWGTFCKTASLQTRRQHPKVKRQVGAHLPRSSHSL